MGLPHMGFHECVGFGGETAIEAMEVESGHSELAVRVRLRARVWVGEDFEVLEFDALKMKNNNRIFFYRKKKS